MKLRCTAGNPLAVKAVAAAVMAGADLEIESVAGIRRCALYRLADPFQNR